MNDGDDMNVEIRTTTEATIVRPVGEIDLSRSPALRVHLREAQKSKPRLLIVDLGEVPYMDSSGVAILVEAMRVAQKNGSKLVLCDLQVKVRSIFEIARLDTVFTIKASSDEALKV